MRRLTTLLIPVTVCLAGLTACASSPDQEPSEVLRLVEVGGEPLPVSYPEEDGCEEEILGATLYLMPDGQWEMEQRKREVCGGEVEEDEDVETGTFTVDGSAYRFAGPEDGTSSPGEVEIEKLSEGTLAGGVLTARLVDGTTVTFRRQEP